MVSCVVPGCKSSLDKRIVHAERRAGVAFHRFPKDEKLKKQWIAAVNRPNWQPVETSAVCTLHFAEHFVNRTYATSGPKLRENAVPTILDWSLQATESQPSTSSENVVGETIEPVSCFVPFCRAQGSFKFGVPKDPEIRKKWESAIQRIDGRAMTENDVVCELHFLRSMINITYEKDDEKDVFLCIKTLAEDALPVVLHGTNKDSSQEIKTKKNVTSPRRKKCCVPNCPSLESPTTTLHQFPVKAARRKNWLKILNMTDFAPTKLTRVCSKHFSASSFSNPGELSPNAVPKLSTASKRIKQESDSEIILSEAQKTAAWLQSVRQKRERMQRKRASAQSNTPKTKKTVKYSNPWGLRDCSVTINKKEKKLADDALSKCDYDPMSWLKNLGVPLPIVQVKEEDPEVTDLIEEVEMDNDPESPPPKVRPLRPILPRPEPATQPPPGVSSFAIPSVVTSNNLMFQTTLRSASEVKSVQEQPLPPSTIYRVIIPTTVQGHTIETNSILQQLKEKISALHQKKVTQLLGSPQVPTGESCSPSEPLSSTISASGVTLTKSQNVTSTPSTSSTTPNILRDAVKKSGSGSNATLKQSKLILVDDASDAEMSSVGDHAYALQPNATSWPILIQNQVPSVLPTLTDIKLVSSTPGLPVTQTQSPNSNENQSSIPSSNVTPKKPPSSVKSLVQKEHEAANHLNQPLLFAPVESTPSLRSSTQNEQSLATSSAQKATPSSADNTVLAPGAPLKQPILQLPVLNLPSLVPSIPLSNQGGMLQMVPNGSHETGTTSYVKVAVPGKRNASYVAVKSISFGTQTKLSINADFNQQQASRAIEMNETNKTKLKRLRQNLRRTQDRLIKATKELEDLKSMKALFQDIEKGLDNVIIIETADKCKCYQERREHEDLEDLLRYAVQKNIPPPAESKKQLQEKEKLVKRIELIKRRLQKKEILKVIVLQTEDILPVM